MATNLDSSTVAGGDDALATQYNNLRKDVIQNAGDYEDSGGAANAYTLSIDAAISAYAAGQIFKFKANHANTGASTLNINGIGALTIKKNGGAADLIVGDIVTGQLVFVMYDGTNLQLLSPGRVINDIYLVTAGDTIAVNSIVCYDETENEWMLADANDTARVRARGIALTAGVDAGQMLIQTGGIYTAPSGTPFTAESQHYLSDTAGGVSTTPSTTTSVPIGYATSTTEMIITWGKKMAKGTGSDQSLLGTIDETITLGFRAEQLILIAEVDPDGTAANKAWGTVHYIGGVSAVGWQQKGTLSVDTYSLITSISSTGSGDSVTVSATNFTDKTFDIRTVGGGGGGGASRSIKYIAIGE